MCVHHALVWANSDLTLLCLLNDDKKNRDILLHLQAELTIEYCARV